VSFSFNDPLGWAPLKLVNYLNCIFSTFSQPLFSVVQQQGAVLAWVRGMGSSQTVATRSFGFCTGVTHHSGLQAAASGCALWPLGGQRF